MCEDVCEGIGVVLWLMRSVCAAESVVMEGKDRGACVECELTGNVVCVWRVFEGVDECMDVLEDKTGTGVGEFVGVSSCRSVLVEGRVYVSVSVTTSPNVRSSLGVEEKSVKPKVPSSTLGKSGDEERELVAISVFTSFLCVTVCSSLFVQVNGEDVSGDGECVKLSVLCGELVLLSVEEVSMSSIFVFSNVSEASNATA